MLLLLLLFFFFAYLSGRTDCVPERSTAEVTSRGTDKLSLRLCCAGDNSSDIEKSICLRGFYAIESEQLPANDAALRSTSTRGKHNKLQMVQRNKNQCWIVFVQKRIVEI